MKDRRGIEDDRERGGYLLTRLGCEAVGYNVHA